MTSHNFDKTALRRIYNLLLLKGQCDAMDSQFMEELFKFDMKFPNTPSASFFSAMANVVDTYIVTLVNEEVSSSSPNRHPLAEILICSQAENGQEGENKYFRQAASDCAELFSKRINDYIGSIILDFIVSTYSVFEKYTCMLHDGLLEDRKPSKSRKKKILKILNNHLEGRVEKFDELDKIADNILQDMKFYKSGSEKIDFLFSKLSQISKSKYPRDIKEDIDIIKLYRNLRNTIHNLGYHLGQDIVRYGKDGLEISLSSKSPAYFGDFNDAFIMCGNLMNIYLEIVRSIDVEKIDAKFLLQL